MQMYAFFISFKRGMKMVFFQFLQGFAALLYPDTCCACAGILLKGEQHLCSYCRVSLPKTDFYQFRENQLSRVFWGKIPVETGTALYYYQKGGRVQKLIRQFKYHGNTALGHYLGFLLGQSMQGRGLYQGLDMILPVPLHPWKERKRGFNQSVIIARGISEALPVPCCNHLLVRRQPTSTQTRKSRYKRWENVSLVFDTPDTHALQNKNILLVDDVVTTGSTLEACGDVLLKAGAAKLWVATLAITL